MKWFHGDANQRGDFDDQTWDRERFSSSLNEEGPGLYFTSKVEQAITYGPHLYLGETLPGFRFMPDRKPTLKLLETFASYADQDDREVFVSNWSEEWSPAAERRALAHYARQDDIHGALITLYSDLFRHDARVWVAAVVSLGFDGAIRQKSYGVQHLVVWNPRKMSIRETYFAGSDDD